MGKKLFTNDAAQLLKLSTKTIHQMEADGRLKAERIGSQGTRLFDEDDVRRVKAERDAKKKR